MPLDLQPPIKDERDQAEFNSAFAFLERLNKIEYLIEACLINWKLRDAYATLESYENELAYCFKLDKKKKVDEQKEVNEIKGKILKIFKDYPGVGNIIKGGIIYQKEWGVIRIKLVELNKYLRKIKVDNGLHMPKKGEGKMF